MMPVRCLDHAWADRFRALPAKLFQLCNNSQPLCTIKWGTRAERAARTAVLWGRW